MITIKRPCYSVS